MNSRRPQRVNTDYYLYLNQCKRQEMNGFLYSRKLKLKPLNAVNNLKHLLASKSV